MKNILINKKTSIILGIVIFLGLFTFLPTETFAQESYKFLQPLPGIASELPAENVLSIYLSNLFKILIGLAIMLSIGMIVLGGLQYLGGEAAKTKGAGVQRLNGAIFGLAIALFAWLFLNTLNPALTEFNLDINVSSVNKISGIPDLPGWFYARTDPDTGAQEWVGSGTATENVVYTYEDCPGGVEPSENPADCRTSKIERTYSRGFYSQGLCEDASEEDDGITSASCVSGNNENGIWYFTIATGLLADSESVGLFPTKAACETEYTVMDGTSGVRMRGDCTIDLNRATSEAVLTGFSDGWYFGSLSNKFPESIPHGPHTTAERCGSNRSLYRQTTDCVRIVSEQLTGASASGGGETDADKIADLPATCDGCIPVPSEIPLKSTIRGDQLHADTANRLVTLTEALKTGRDDGSSISWQVTEVYKPSFIHLSPCHQDGRCFDANFTGTDRSTVESALAAGQINTALNIIEDFMEAAEANGFTAYYEVVTSTQAILLKADTNFSATRFRYVAGATANHFHIE